MKFFVFAVLALVGLGGCTADKSDTSEKTADSAAE
jgi:hypothetical protein